MQDTRTQQKWVNSIGKMTENPAAKAATPEATDLYLANVQEAVSSGRRQQALNNVSLGYIQSQARANAANLGTGARKGKPKMDAVAGKIAAAGQAARDAAASLPKGKRGDREAAKARMGAAVDAIMSAWGY